MTNSPTDWGQLPDMAVLLEKEMGIVPQKVLADAGYYVEKDIKEVESKGSECFVAVGHNQHNLQEVSFQFDQRTNTYKCSEGQVLRPKYGLKRDNRRGTVAQRYQAENCGACAMKPKCTKAANRTVYRFSDQDWKDSYKTKMQSPQGNQPPCHPPPTQQSHPPR